MTPADVKRLRVFIKHAELSVEYAVAKGTTEGLQITVHGLQEALRILGRAVVEVLTDADRAQAADAAGRN